MTDFASVIVPVHNKPETIETGAMTAPSAPEFVDFYDPDFYDLRIGPGRRVADLYAQLAAERGGPVLELGCGTGQVILEIAKAGVSAVGLEVAPAMIERARRNIAAAADSIRSKTRLIQGLMEDFEPDQEYAQVFFSNDVIAHVHDNTTLVGVLRKFRQRLAPRGRVVLDVSPFNYAHMGRFAESIHQSPRWRGESPWRDGGRIAVWETTRVDPQTGLLLECFRYEIIGADGRVREMIDRRLRLYHRRSEELLLILSAAGFSAVRHSRRPDPSGDFLVFEAA
jgi:SAM-dependent methyltransferase